MTSSSKPFPWFWILVLLLSDVSNWMFDKMAVVHSSGTGIDFYISILTKPWIWFTFAPLPFQFYIWTYILKNTDLSKAYPATSLSYPLTMLAAHLFFHESPSALVWIGGLFVTIGVALIGSEAHEDPIDESNSARVTDDTVAEST